jgi:hypothetical protein
MLLVATGAGLPRRRAGEGLVVPAAEHARREFRGNGRHEEDTTAASYRLVLKKMKPSCRRLHARRIKIKNTYSIQRRMVSKTRIQDIKFRDELIGFLLFGLLFSGVFLFVIGIATMDALRVILGLSFSFGFALLSAWFVKHERKKCSINKEDEKKETIFQQEGHF